MRSIHHLFASQRLAGALAIRAACFMALMPAALFAQISIFRPEIGVPAFPVTNGTFYVEVEAVPGLASNGWSALLINDLRSWICSVERVDYGYYVNCNSTTGYQLTVRTPADTAPEVFKLAVGHVSAGFATNRHCIRILQNYETNFYILHYADPQVETENATAANGAGGSHGSVQAINWASHSYRLINPRFMFNTGDEVENGSAAFYPKYLNAIDTIGAPLLITRGNNDARGSYADWKRDIGQPTYSITMGSFYICMKDYGTNENQSWFTNDYAESFANTSITFRLFGQHYTNGGFTCDPPAGQYPDLMLVGHNHSFSTLRTNPYYVLSSGPGWDYGAVAIFEFIKSGGGWLCSNKTIHGTSNKLHVYGDWGSPDYVTNTFLYANDGAADTNTTYITNSLNYDFWDGQVRFLMRKSTCGYAVSGGDKTAEYDYSGTNTAVLVKVNIRGNALTTVTVFPLGTNRQTQTITFPPIADQVVTAAVGLSATASSALPVSFSVAGGPAQITGGTNLGFTGTGLVSIVASQAGNSNWYAAPSVTNSLTVADIVANLCADIDGDGLGDMITVVGSNWYVWFSKSHYLVRGGPYDLGVYGLPAAGDLDDDGRPDLISVVGSQWYVWFSSSEYLIGSGPYDLGIAGRPAAGYIDDDDRADLIAVMGSNWYVWFSTSHYLIRCGPYVLTAP